MAKISVGLELAWRSAVAEAMHGGHELIDPEHLFIGVCKIGSLT
jgi:hypothetical protein